MAKKKLVSTENPSMIGTEMFAVSVKIQQKLQEINARMSELDRCFPFIDDKDFYNERKRQLEDRRKQLLEDVEKFSKQLEDMEV